VAAGKFDIYDSTAATPRIVIDSTGQVGIGTTAPGAKLAVQNGQVYVTFDNGQTNFSGPAGYFDYNYGTDDAAIRNVITLQRTTANRGQVGTGGRINMRIRGGEPTVDGAYIEWVNEATVPNASGQTPGVGLRFWASQYNLSQGNDIRERMRIDQYGNVGIGTTAPTSQLYVKTSTDKNNLYVDASSNVNYGAIVSNNAGSGLGLQVIAGNAAGTGTIFSAENTAPVFQIKNNGNVGIGTTGPGAPLHILKAGTNLSGTNNYIAQFEAATNDNGILLGYDTSGVIGTITANHTSGNLAFWTHNGTAWGERVRINSAGNVGIGTTSPQALLHIADTSVNTAKNLFIQGNSATANVNKYSGIQFGRYGSATAGFVGIWGDSRSDRDELYIGGGAGSQTAASAIRLYTGTLGTSVGTERVTIQSDGNVGIGTTGPRAVLSLGNTTGQKFLIYDDGATPTLNRAGFGVDLSGGPYESSWLFSNGSTGQGFATIGSWDGTTYSSKVKIQANGNVGIGNTSPDYKLDVGIKSASPQSPTAGSGGLIRNASPADQTPYTQARIMVYGGTSIDTNNFAYLGYGDDAIMRIVYGNSSQPYALQIGRASAYNGTGSFSPEMTVKQGNVGIGTMTPDALLALQGAHLANNALKINLYAGTPQGFGTAEGIMYAALAGASDRFAIYDTVAKTNELLTVKGSGNVGIGTTNPGYQLQLSLDSAAKPTSNTWTIASDARIKDVVGAYTRGLAEILQINPILYTYKPDNALGIVDPGTHIGIIAQDIQQVIPEAISTDTNGFLHFTADPVNWAMVNAVKELASTTISLQNQINALNQSLIQATSTLTAQQGTIDLASLNNDLNLNGFSLLNVKSISGMNGLWKIDESGNITAQNVNTQTISSVKGFTTYDEDTGQPVCIKIKSGRIIALPGYCQDVNASNIVPASAAASDTAATSTTPISETTLLPAATSTEPILTEPVATSTEPVVASTTPLESQGPLTGQAEPVVVSTTTPETATPLLHD
jgi:hypothetical protein